MLVGGSSTAQVRGEDCVSWKPLAASLSIQELKARNDVLSLFLLELARVNGAAFLVSMLLWRHWRMREVDDGHQDAGCTEDAHSGLWIF